MITRGHYNQRLPIDDKTTMSVEEIMAAVAQDRQVFHSLDAKTFVGAVMDLKTV